MAVVRTVGRAAGWAQLPGSRASVAASWKHGPRSRRLLRLAPRSPADPATARNSEPATVSPGPSPDSPSLVTSACAAVGFMRPPDGAEGCAGERQVCLLRGSPGCLWTRRALGSEGGAARTSAPEVGARSQTDGARIGQEAERGWICPPARTLGPRCGRLRPPPASWAPGGRRRAGTSGPRTA